MNSNTSSGLTEERQAVIIPILRWIAVLPAAVASFFGVQLLIILINSMTSASWSDRMLQLINSGASAYYFVYAGARTAPTYQFVVGIVLAILFGIFVVVIATVGFFIKTTDPLWWLILAGVISLVAAIASVVRLSENR